MITYNEYLEAKDIILKYKKQFKKNAGRKKIEISDQEKKEGIYNIFKKNDNLKYTELIVKISSEFKIGVNLSKKIFTEFKGVLFIHKAGGYYLIK